MTGFVWLLLIPRQWQPEHWQGEGVNRMTEIKALRAIMSELEALQQILKSVNPELADARPKLDEERSIAGELIETAERVKERWQVKNLAQDVQRQIGNVCGACRSLSDARGPRRCTDS